MLCVLDVQVRCVFLLLLVNGCANPGSEVPSKGNAGDPAFGTDQVSPLCSVDLSAPERWQTVLTANDVRGVDCVPPQGGEVFALGFAHAGWWMQLDVARASLVLGAAHPFDGQAALLALDCWQWDGSVTVESDRPDWAVRIDARCTQDGTVTLIGRFAGHDPRR